MPRPVFDWFCSSSAFAFALSLFLTPAAASENCKVEKRATFSLGSTGYLSTVPAQINGASVTLGLDTGAQTYVTPEAVSRLHLPRDRSRTARTHGATGTVLAHYAVLRDLEFAGAHRHGKSVPELELAVAGQVPYGQVPSLGTPIAGLLGADILSEYDLDFDFSQNALTLYHVRGCSSIRPPWDGVFSSIPIKITGQKHVAVPVELDGRKFTAIFDTGAYRTSISRSSASRLGLTKKILKNEPVETVVGAGNISAKVPTREFQTLSVSGQSLRNLRVNILKVPLMEADMLLGQDFMRSRRFWVSYATRTMFVQSRAALQAPMASLTVMEQQLIKQEQHYVGALAQTPLQMLRRKAEAERQQTIPQKAETPSQTQQQVAEARPQPQPQTPPQKGAGYLSVSLRDLAPQSVKTLGLAQDRAIIVENPLRDGPADKAGLRPGDVILSLDDKPVFSARAFMAAVRQRAEGETIRLEILREGQRTIVAATVGGPAEAERIKITDANREGRSEDLIAAENSLLKFFGPDGFREDWAWTQWLLGNAYLQRGKGSRSENVESAIAAYKAALGVYTAEKTPERWAALQDHLGNAYVAGAASGSSDNIGRAIEAFQAALTVTQADYPEDWAATEIRLGDAYSSRAAGGQTGDIELAIKAYEAALTVLTLEDEPVEWGAAQSSLGNAYWKRLDGERSDNIERAIGCYKAALKAMGVAFAPKPWGEAHKNLGLAYRGRVQGDKAENLKLAAIAYRTALSALTAQNFPQEHEEVSRLLAEVETKEGR